MQTINQIVSSNIGIDSINAQNIFGESRMRYVQLRAFHHVAICGGFSRAAEHLLLTQPAISDQVRKLEEEYDILLFNRHKK
ncbi:MAG: LysR family transcriptional regulator, partial [Caldilineaceae bacterium]|nr:LysR family transcriptional regulator [Caldilineaceae bacterium]